MTDQQVFVRTSERTLFTKCRQAWDWSYVQARQPKDAFSVPLIFGDMVHRSLAEYYIPETPKHRKRGPHPAQTFARLYQELEQRNKEFRIKVEDDRWVTALELGTEMMENYVDHWREEDKDIVVLFPEMPFSLKLDDPDTGEYLCTYIGVTDALIMRASTRKLGLFEHKTAASISTDHLFLDEQASSYWCLIPIWLLREGVIKPENNLDFMLYNFMRKAQKDDRPQNEAGQYLNKNGTVSKIQPPPLFQREIVYRGQAERTNTFNRIVEQVREMNMVRSGAMATYKAPNRDCKFCEWRDLCELHETGSDWKELRRQTTLKWDPYRQHAWAVEL